MPDIAYIPDPELVREFAEKILQVRTEDVDYMGIGQLMTCDERTRTLDRDAFDAVQSAIGGMIRIAKLVVMLPGQPDLADRFSITWDYDFAYLWCEDCPGDERPVDAFPGNPTAIAEIQAAMRKHRVETHEEN